MVSSAGKMDVNRFGLHLPDVRKQHLKPAHTTQQFTDIYKVLLLIIENYHGLFTPS